MGSRPYSLIQAIGLALFSVTVMIHILSLSFPESYAIATASTIFSNGTATFEDHKVSAIEWGSHISCYAFDGSDDAKDLCQKTRNAFKINTTDLHGHTVSAVIATNEAQTWARNSFDYVSLGFTGLSVVFAGTHHTFQKHGWCSSAASAITNIITIAMQEVMFRSIRKNAGDMKIGTTTQRQSGYWLLIIRILCLIASSTLVHFGHEENRALAKEVKEMKQIKKDFSQEAKENTEDNNDDQDSNVDNNADDST